MNLLRYGALGFIGIDEFMRSRYSGQSPTEALGSAVNKGFMTSILLPKKGGMQQRQPGTQDPRRLGVALGAKL